MVNSLFNFILILITILFSKELFSYDEELIIVFCLSVAILCLFKFLGNFLALNLKNEILLLNNKFISIFEKEAAYLSKFEKLLLGALNFNNFSISLVLNIFLFLINNSYLNLNLWKNFVNKLFNNIIYSILFLKYDFFIFYYLKKIYIYLLNLKNIIFFEGKSLNMFYFNKFIYFLVPKKLKLKLKLIYFLTLKFNCNFRYSLFLSFFYYTKI